MSFASSEGGFFDALVRYQQSGVSNQDWLLKAHSGDPLRIDRKGRPPESVDQPLATLALTAQPYVLERIDARGEFRGKGLLARVLFSLPTSLVGRRDSLPPSVPEQLIQRYEGLVGDLSQVAGNHKLLLDDAAAAALHQFRDALERRLGPEGDLRDIADWANKLAGTCVRIAALLHMARHGRLGITRPVSHTTMCAALRIGEYALEHAHAAFGLVGTDPAVAAARRVLEWIECQGCTRFQARDAFEGVKGTLKDMKTLNTALARLEEHQYLRREPEHRGGRGRPRSPTYVVNPNVRSRYSHKALGGAASANTASEQDFDDRAIERRDARSDANEAALMAELDALVASGLATWRDTPGGDACVGTAALCAYPAHRQHDWRTRTGRLVCGVCHPPADPHLVSARRT